MVTPISGGSHSSYPSLPPVSRMINQVEDLMGYLESGNEFSMYKEFDNLLYELNQWPKKNAVIQSVIADLTEAKTILEQKSGDNPVAEARGLIEKSSTALWSILK